MSVMNRTKGLGLVEVVVAAAIVTLIVTSLIAAFLVYFRTGLEVVARVQATFLAEEGVEAVKFLRDKGWTTSIAPLSLNTPYYLATTSTLWEATTTSSLELGKFSRKLQFYSVNRDTNGAIVSSGGTTDNNTRKVFVEVTWQTASGSSTRSIPTYITNLFND